RIAVIRGRFRFITAPFRSFPSSRQLAPSSQRRSTCPPPWCRAPVPEMHWLVEVSRVGDTVASARYCIEARRWQSALQEARRLRGDPGALPKLTIELT